MLKGRPVNSAVSTPEQSLPGWRKALTGLGRIEALPILLASLALVLAFGLYEPRFFRQANLINILRNSSFLIIISCGQMLALVVGGFDLSVGAVVALASITSASVMVALDPLLPNQVALVIALGILAALLVGALVGLVNGLCVALLKVPPFIVTLGTMSVASGVALYATTGIPIYGMPKAFMSSLGQARWWGLPVAVYITAGVVAALWWVLKWTRLGRHIYAIGGNEYAARVSGVRVNLYTIFTYVLCSILAALTGVLLTARLGSGEGTMGGEFIMESIAAAVLGGVAIGGGLGRAQYVAVGAVFLTLVTNGMNLLRVDSKLQSIVIGIILVLGIALDRLRRGPKNNGGLGG